MTHAAFVLSAAALTLAGCGRSAERRSAEAEVAPATEAGAGERGDTAEAEPAAQTCQARAAELTHFLRAMDHEPQLVSVGQDLELVTRGHLPREAVFLPVVEVTPGGFRFEGHSARLATELAATLAERFARGRAAHEAGISEHTPDPGRIYLAVDRRASWDAVVSATRVAFDAGFSLPSFVFARQPATAPPPASPVDAQLDAIDSADPSQRAVEAARLLEKLVTPCSPLIRLFGTIASARDKTALLVDGIGPALVECDCRVDIPSLRATLWRIVGNPRPLTFAELPLARDGKQISLPAHTPWSEASEHIIPLGEPTWLVLSHH